MSVTKLTDRTCSGASGLGNPTRIAAKMTRISERLHEKRKWITFFRLA
jgi:hypothetical protein